MAERKDKPIGLTKDAGWQMGVRRTFPISLKNAWTFLVSPEGSRLWLDGLDLEKIEIKQPFETPNGYFGKITVFKPQSHLRMQWKHPDWDNISILQIRTIPNKEKTVISFHQEKLSGPEQRVQMKSFWQDVLSEFENIFGENQSF